MTAKSKYFHSYPTKVELASTVPSLCISIIRKRDHCLLTFPLSIYHMIIITHYVIQIYLKDSPVKVPIRFDWMATKSEFVRSVMDVLSTNYLSLINLYVYIHNKCSLIDIFTYIYIYTVYLKSFIVAKLALKSLVNINGPK